MAIYEYSEGDHAAGYQGLRVAVSVGTKLRQKYFAFRVEGEYVSLAKERGLRREARKLEKAWLIEQEVEKAKRTAEAIELRKTPYQTGVKGIKLKNLRDDRLLVNGEYNTHYYPCFVVHGSTDGVQFYKNFYIKGNNFNGAWEDAVTYYAKHKGIENFKHLLKRRPWKAKKKKL